VKEQVIAQKVGSRSGSVGKSRSAGLNQRPARREAEPLTVRLRALVGYVPKALKIFLLIAVAALGFLGYRAAAAASFFQIRTVETKGLNRASSEAIETAVRQDVSKTGVWSADLTEIGAHLERLPWVRTAIVTRVLPDGIRVRVTERQPRAVVRTTAGRFLWVDEDAVVLSEMASTDPMPSFFLRGWNEEDSNAARTENRARVIMFLEMQREWDAQGLSERVSEVNLLDVRDARAQLAGDDSRIEVRLGAQDQGKRLKSALDTLDKLRQTPRGPYISYLDVNQGKRVVVGMVNGGHSIDGDEVDDVASDSTTPTVTKSAAEKVQPAKVVNKDKERDAKTRNATKKPEQKRT